MKEIEEASFEKGTKPLFYVVHFLGEEEQKKNCDFYFTFKVLYMFYLPI